MALRRHDPSIAATGRATLPPDRAFVVQIRAGADLEGGVFAGRVEHITSGAVTRFETLEQLVRFITTTIQNS